MKHIYILIILIILFLQIIDLCKFIKKSLYERKQSKQIEKAYYENRKKEREYEYETK